MTPRGTLTFLEAFHFVGQELYGGDWREGFLELVLPVTSDNYLRYLLADQRYTEEAQKQASYVHWLILRLLKKHRSSFILKSTTDKGPPVVNPFDCWPDLYRFADIRKSLICHISLPEEYSYFIFLNKVDLKKLLNKGKVEHKTIQCRKKIDTDLFIQLMNEQMWSNKETIHRHGGKKAFILRTVLNEYLSDRPDHVGAFNHTSYLDNKEISSHFANIRQEVLTGRGPKYDMLSDAQKALVDDLIDYQWQWHIVLGMKPRQSKSVASKAMKQFRDKLPNSLKVSDDKLQVFAVLERNSAKGYLHWHLLINNVIDKKQIKKTKEIIARLWGEVLIEDSQPCSRPTLTEAGWFKEVYSRCGILCYMIKEWQRDRESTEIFDNAIFHNCELKKA